MGELHKNGRRQRAIRLEIVNEHLANCRGEMFSVIITVRVVIECTSLANDFILA